MDVDDQGDPQPAAAAAVCPKPSRLEERAVSMSTRIPRTLDEALDLAKQPADSASGAALRELLSQLNLSTTISLAKTANNRLLGMTFLHEEIKNRFDRGLWAAMCSGLELTVEVLTRNRVTAQDRAGEQRHAPAPTSLMVQAERRLGQVFPSLISMSSLIFCSHVSFALKIFNPSLYCPAQRHLHYILFVASKI